VAKDGSYANLESKATGTTGSGGFDRVGTTVTILAGLNSSSGSTQTVSMSWQTQTLDERTSPMLISDVLHLGGMGLDDSGQTAPFVLQMNYNPNLLPLGIDSEETWASNKWIYLAWRNPITGSWQNAIDGNFGTNLGSFHQGAWVSGEMTLGNWGVNTVNNTVWAVLDHNSDFAVVPEPSSLVLLGIAGIGLAGWAWRRRRVTDQSEQEEDAPAILSFHSHSSHQSESARRAA